MRACISQFASTLTTTSFHIWKAFICLSRFLISSLATFASLISFSTSTRYSLSLSLFFPGEVLELLIDSCFQVYAMLDEVFLAGEVLETSKLVVLQRLADLEKLD